MTHIHPLAPYMDHTLLGAPATKQQILTLCEEAKTHQFASVCVSPCYVALASKALHQSGVNVCTVVGFPLGTSTTKTKVFEAQSAVLEGAQEIDMVIHIGMVKDHDEVALVDEVSAVVTASKQDHPETIVKVIIETCLLTPDEIDWVCRALCKTGADFVKTSTGYSTGGATVEDVTRMKQAVMGNMKVKASGGIRNLQDAHAMIDAGADRLGVSAGVAIVQGDDTTRTGY